MKELTAMGAQQEHSGAIPVATPPLIRLARTWTPPTAYAHTRTRLLAVLAQNGEAARNERRPWSWWMVRHRLGGTVGTDTFGAIVGELLAEGLLIDVVEETGDRRHPRHLLVLTARWHDYEWEMSRIVAVEGRKDVLTELGLLMPCK